MPQATQAELEAILHGVAVAHINDRAFLRISGVDATRWLNGMVTNSIQSLQPGEGNYNFLLNAQGRIQGDCTIYREPHDGEPTFLLVTDSSQLKTIQETLDRFIIMDDVELEHLDYFREIALLLGPEASDVLRAIEHPMLSYDESFADLPPLHTDYYKLTSEQICTPAPSLVPMFEITAVRTYDDFRDEAIAAGALDVSPAALEAFRIFRGTPRFGVDIRDRDLPQETSQTHALHFAKGCYLGQEIVERIRSRGQVHRQFTRFRLSGEPPASLPALLEADGKPVGELTSAALVPLSSGSELYALGYARREFLDQRKEFTYAGGTAMALAASHHTTGN